MVWTLLFGGVSSVVIAFAFSQPAGADPPVTVYAATSGTGDACSSTSPCGLQEAIDTADATSGAVVVSLAAGTYSGAFTIDDENTDSDASLTLSGGGPSSVILDGGGTTTPFTIASTNVVPVILEGATVENGSNTSTTVGGGVSDLASSGTLTVSNDAFTANAASLGGGLFSTVRTSISGSMFSDNSSSQNGAGALVGASATVSSSTFEGDSASGNGGGLEIDGAATLSSDAFTNNSAGYEGGGAYTGGLTDVIGCNFSANSLTAPGLVGAGLAAGGDGVTTTVTSSVFTHNMNAGEGNGAVFFGNATISGSSFTDNSSSGAVFGGGAMVDGNGSISNSTFTGNTTGDGGEGIGFLDEGNATISHSTFSENSATGGGHGIGLGVQGSGTISGSTINDNSAVGGDIEGVGAYIENSLSLDGSSVSGNTGTDADLAEGGGFLADNLGITTVDDSSVLDNTLRSSGLVLGGGAYTSSLTIDSSTVSTNSAISTSPSSNGAGGGLNVQGNVLVEGSSVDNNTLSASTATGGGIQAQNATVEESTIADNAADGDLVDGGGLNGEAVSLSNATFTGNTADAGGGFQALGGGMSVTSLELKRATIADNAVSGGSIHSGGGGIDVGYGSGSTFGSVGSIVADNTASYGNPNCDESATSSSYSLESGTDCGFDAGTDHQDTDPLLQALAFPSGYAPTLGLGSGSPALNGIGAAADACTGTSENGVRLSQTGSCDIGAYEHGTAGSVLEPLGGSLPAAATAGGSNPSSATCGCSGPQASFGEPVNTATGDFYTTTTDLTVPGAGVPLAFTSTYDSGLAQREVANSESPGPLGYGWSDSLDLTLTLDAATGLATVRQEDGSEIQFAPHAPGALPAWCTDGANYCPVNASTIATLNQNSDGSWTLTRTIAGSEAFTFNASGVLTAITDAAGDSLVATSGTPGSGECDSSATSCTVWTSSASGRSLTLNLNSSGLLTRVTDQAGDTATFCHHGDSCASGSDGQSGDLASMTLPGDLTTGYDYDTSQSSATYQHDLVTVIPPGGATTAETVNTYDSAGRIVSQTEPGGAVDTFSYSADSYADGNGSATGGTTTVTSYPDGTGSGEPSSTDVFTYAYGVLDSESVGSAGTKTYDPDPATLQSTSSTDLDGNSSSVTLAGPAGGSATPSANVLTSTDGDGNTTAYAYTALNLPWCEVAPAEYADGVRCPATEPTAPQAAGTSYAYPGVALTFYDSVGDVTATTDALGNTTLYAYTSGIAGVPDHLQYCEVDPANYAKGVVCPAYETPPPTGTSATGATTKTFDAAGDVLTSTNPVGATTSNTYNTAGQLVTTTDPDGTTTTDTYDTAGHVIESSQSFDGYVATTLTAYDSMGRQFCTVAPAEVAIGVTCPSSPPSSPPTPAAHPTSSTDPYLGATITTYNGAGEVIQETNPLGGVTLDAYDGSGNQVCSAGPAATASGVTCGTAVPAAPGSFVCSSTPLSDPDPGATVDFYNSLGQLVQEDNPLGGATLTTFDANGNKTCVSVVSNDTTHDPTVTTTDTYDADNNLVTETVAGGTGDTETTVSSYDPDGNVFCSVSAVAFAAGSSAYQCPAWQAGWIAEPPSPTALYASSPTAAQAKDVTTTFDDADGNQVQSSTALGGTSISVFDPDGKAFCTATADNVAAWLVAHPAGQYPYLCPTTEPSTAPATGSDPGYTTTLFDAAGQATSVTDPTGDTTTTQHDPDGEVTTSTDPLGNVTTNCYYWEVATCASSAPAGGGDASALYSTTTPPTQADTGGLVTTTTYIAGGATATTTTPAGKTSESYDAEGDVTAKDYSDTASGYSTPANVTMTYNPDGTKATMTDGTGVTTYTYDENGDMTSQSLAAASGTGLTSNTVSYAYYSTGVRKSVVYPAESGDSTPTATYTYDASGQMASVSDPNGETTDFTHDPDNNLTSTAFPDATTATDAYNSDDAMTSTTVAPTATPASPVAQMSYSRDSGDLVAGETDTGVVQNSSSFTYDAAGRVTSGDNWSTGYNADGEPGTAPAGANNQFYDAAGEATEGGYFISPYTYDTLGDRTGVSDAPALPGESDSYSYDQLGELTATAPVATSTSKGQYVSLATPTRVCDTRPSNPSGLSGTANQCDGTTLTDSNESETIHVSGFGSVPSTATAVVADVTVLDTSADTTVTAYTGGQAEPAITNVSVAAGERATNQVTIALGADGSFGDLAFTNATGSADVLVDVLGYFTTVNGAGGGFTTVTESRICDTRTGSGLPCAGETLSAGTPLQVQVASATSGVPADATSAVVDLTAVDPSTDTTLTAVAGGQPAGTTTSLSASAGATVTTEVTVPLNQANGTIDVYNSAGTTDVTVDVQGYYSGTGTDSFTATPGVTASDTRPGNPSGLTGLRGTYNNTPLAAGATMTVKIAGFGTAPTAHVAVIDVTAVNETGSGYLSIYPANTARPTTSQLSFSADTPVTVEDTAQLQESSNTDRGYITIYAGNATTDVIVDVLGYYQASTGGVTASSYQYDGDGVRAGVTIAGSTSTETWDTTTSTPAILSDGTNDYIYGPNGEVVEQLNTSTNTPTYLVQDQLGSTRLLVDTSGSVVGAFAFDVWGNPIVQGSSVPSPIGYAGGYTDSATGLIYLVNRYYDPVTGQFMSVDPDVASTLEPYGYVNDDPINESDSDGQLGCGFLWLGTCSANSVSTARPSPINGSSWNFSQAAGTPSQTTQPINLTLRLHSQVAVLVVDRTFLATGGIDVAICADDGSRGCYQLGLLYGQVSHPVNLPVDSTAAGDANYRYTVDAYQVSADDLFKPDPFDPSESANVPGLGMGCNGGDCEEDPFYGGGAGEDVQISQCAPRPSGATLLADYGPALDPTDFGTVVTWTGRKVSGPFQ